MRVGIVLTTNRGRAGSAWPGAVVRKAKPPPPPPMPLAEPPEPPWFEPGHLTVTEIVGMRLVPGLRTWITKFAVVASRCCDGKLALRTSTGKLPFGSLASRRAAAPHPATVAAAARLSGISA